MNTHIIACRTIEDELRAAMGRTGTDLPVCWLESGLHNTPQKLNTRLQQELDGLAPGRVLLAMGFCGNSLTGLQTGAHELIVPRCDDCISLLMGSVEARVNVSRELAAYFLTEGWLRGERNLWVEYRYTLEKYGPETAEMIGDMMYGHYRSLALLDTGIAPMAPLLDSTKIIADTLKLQQAVVPGTLRWLEQLLTGPWEGGDFLIIPPHSTVRGEDLFLPLSTPLQ